MITSPIDSVVQVRSAGKRYPLRNRPGHAADKAGIDEFWALKDLSFEVKKGQTVGVIGRNGAGKTTLLNLIAGVLAPTEGSVDVTGRVMGLFNLGVGFVDELSGRENVFLNGSLLGAGRAELENKLDDIIEFSELGGFIDMPLGTYSQGMRLRLGFSIVANLDFDVLIIDEVLAVGDCLFQNKCFERLMAFKRLGKTLVISSQSPELVERLCDRVAVLGHGKLLFLGKPDEAVSQYRLLLNTEKFFVGSEKNDTEEVVDTLKWTDDVSNWDKELGTKEVLIKNVEFFNGLGCKCTKIQSGGSLRVKVDFTARTIIKEPHFGVALFREDGVYCYGPNTAFDGYYIPQIKAGKGSFTIRYHKIFLAPGTYRVSVAVWDKNETIAYAYNHGCYRLTIAGRENGANELTALPYRCSVTMPVWSKVPVFGVSLLKALSFCSNADEPVEIGSVRLSGRLARQDNRLISGEPVRLSIKLIEKRGVPGQYLWVGFFREDGVYCQGITMPLNGRNLYTALFPLFSLLPGGYFVSVGIWDDAVRAFSTIRHAVYPFRMVFDKRDHGTVYLKHSWHWRLP